MTTHKGSTLLRFLLYRVMGWQTDITITLPQKYIIALAPHTSNWDFALGQLFIRAEGIKCQFMMKREWFFWPLGILLRHIGGIPVERSRHTSLTEQVAQTARERDTFALCITPEGTRKPNAEWKRGFYYIALGAGLPIYLFGLDYGRKRIVATKEVVPDGDIDKQMHEIKHYFAQFTGKHPANFVI